MPAIGLVSSRDIIKSLLEAHGYRQVFEASFIKEVKNTGETEPSAHYAMDIDLIGETKICLSKRRYDFLSKDKERNEHFTSIIIDLADPKSFSKVTRYVELADKRVHVVVRHTGKI